MSDVIEEKIRFREANVHVRAVGEGPPLLLINGLGAHSAMWGPLEQTLKGFRLIEFDLPGAGQSDIPWKPVSVSRLASLATSVMDEFDVDRAHVLGYSMGGMVAQQLAFDSPERVDRLVLVATSPGVGALQGDPKALLNIVTPLRYLSPRLYTRTIGSMAGGRARTDPAWAAAQGKLRLQAPPSWRGYFGQLQSLSKWSSLPILGRIDHQTLVVAGDDDPLTPVVNGMMVAHLLPNGRLVVVPGEGHLMVLDGDSQAHTAIREFLSAKDLSRAPVWKRAQVVETADLEAELAAAPRQLPPLSVYAGRARRRYLGIEPMAA
jgi:pimeloyl-ACP methyl ester carboxylesterase